MSQDHLPPNSKVIINNVQHWFLFGDKKDNKLTKQLTAFALNQLPTDSKQAATQAEQNLATML